MSRIKGRVMSGQNGTPGQQQGWTPISADGAPYTGPQVSPAPPSPQTSGAFPPLSQGKGRRKNEPQPVNAGAHNVPVTGGGASPPAVQVMPLQLVQVVRAPSVPYVSIGVSDLDPIYTADGAMIPSTSPGSWGQLRAAGRA